jgi:Protein of unknown function (DUF3309)
MRNKHPALPAIAAASGPQTSINIRPESCVTLPLTYDPTPHPIKGCPEEHVAMFFVLTVVLIIALVGSIPKWPHSKGWGYFPSVGLGLVLLVLLILAIMHRL